MRVYANGMPAAHSPKVQFLTLLMNSTVDATMGVDKKSIKDESILASQRYYKNGARFVGKKSRKEKISYKKMAGKNIAVMQDSVFDKFLHKKFNGVNILHYPNIDAAYVALAADEVEYVLVDRVEQHWLTLKHKEYSTTGPNYSTAKYFSDAVIAVRNADLQQQFNAALKAVINNGTYKKINDRYFPFNIYGRYKQ